MGNHKIWFWFLLHLCFTWMYAKCIFPFKNQSSKPNDDDMVMLLVSIIIIIITPDLPHCESRLRRRLCTLCLTFKTRMASPHTHTHTHTHNDTTAKQADTRSKKEFVDIRRIPFVIFCMQSQRESQGVCYFIVRCTCKGNVKCTHPLVKGYVVVPRFRFPSNQILLQETVTHSHLSEDDSNPNPP